MKKPGRTISGIGALASVSLLVLTGCSAGGSAEPTDEVTITIGEFPRDDDPERVEFVKSQIAEFEKANPNITVETDTYVYDADSFAAALAGDTLPTVFGVPFTEPQSLIAAGQVADITEPLETVGLLDQINPDLLAAASDTDGQAYGVPTLAYSVGVDYNRDIFKAAGLDPDKPPATFDEWREAAKTITEKTGTPGFAVMASGTGGGWTLTALTYAFGGTVENAEGTAPTLDEGATVEALQMLRGMQEDGSLSNNLLLDFEAASDFAAGKFAAFIDCPCRYETAVNAGLPKDAFGATVMPKSDSANATLAGGAFKMVNANATPDQVLAAVEWIKFFDLDAQLSEDAAVAAAKASSESDVAVGVPLLPLFVEDTTAEYRSWIEPYVNVPVENFQPWLDGSASQAVVPEPRTKTQDVYTLLDVLVQTVLSDPDSDIEAAVADYQQQLAELLER